MKTGSIYSYEYQGTTYEFYPSRAARAAIQNLQLNAMQNMKDPAVLSTVMQLQSLNKELQMAKQQHNETKSKEVQEKITELSMQAMGSMKDLTLLQDQSEDEYVIAKLLLMNSKSVNGPVSETLADEILEAMECELGPSAFTKQLLEIYDTVFTMIAEVKDYKKQMQKRIKENTPLPLN